MRGNPTTLLHDLATAYKVNTDAIALKVKQEFAAKANAKKEATRQFPKPRKLPTTTETERRETCRFFVSSNLQIAQGESALVPPCTLIPLCNRPPLVG